MMGGQRHEQHADSGVPDTPATERKLWGTHRGLLDKHTLSWDALKPGHRGHHLGGLWSAPLAASFFIFFLDNSGLDGSTAPLTTAALLLYDCQVLVSGTAVGQIVEKLCDVSLPCLNSELTCNP